MAGAVVDAKTIILVIGCHRSGTSAVTGTLAQMGVKLPADLIPAAVDNPKGFCESRSVVAMHDRLLASVGASWDAPPVHAFCESIVVDGLALILRDLPGPVCVVKDPRASLFVEFWEKACKREGVRLCVVEVRRDPADVVASLRTRERWDSQRALALVQQYEQEIERAYEAFEGDAWVQFNFPDDIANTGRWEVLASVFELDLLSLDPAAAGGFYDPSLIHHGSPNGKCPRWAVIVPSRSHANLCDFVDSLMDAHPEMEASQIVVVSDGLSWRTRSALRGVTWVKGKRQFVFSKAINAGAKAAGMADLLIAGDDVRFDTPRVIDRLAERSEGVAALSPEIQGVCGQPAQRMGSTMSTAAWLAFICVYIPRAAWQAVGPLDERFTGYGYDDVDWCLRSRGYGPLRIDHSVRAIHADCSTYRARSDWDALYAVNQALFEQKWKPSLITGGMRVQ